MTNVVGKPIKVHVSVPNRNWRECHIVFTYTTPAEAEETFYKLNELFKTGGDIDIKLTGVSKS